MIEPKTIIIDKIKFYLQPLRPLKAIRLDKQVLALCIPAFGGVEDLSLDSEIDLSKLTQGISTALQKMEDDVFEKFIKDLFSGACVIEKESPPEELTEEVINRIFRGGKMLTMYKLAFEIMKFNKFTPFELVEGGSVIEKIDSLTKQTKKPTTLKKGSAKLGNLPES